MPHVSPEQRAERRERIVNGAFDAWGRSVFFHTRLDDVADRLRMTRPALYRYFRSKEDLLQAMERHFVSEYTELKGRFESQAADLEPEAAAALFVGDVVLFFGGRIPYFYFLIHHMGTHHDSAIVRAQSQHLEALAAVFGRMRRIHDRATAASYLRATVSFFLMRAGLKGRSPGVLGRQEQARLASLVQKVCAQGYGARGCVPWRPQMLEIEGSCAVTAADVPAEEPILRAVAETVAEHGFADASIERIARRAGLTKSSLYFHFRDRDDMFSRLLERHQERLHELFAARAASCRSTCERLYCFLVVLASYFRNAREVPAVMNWFRYHGYQLRVHHTDDSTTARRFAFLADALREGSLRSHGVSLTYLASHLSFAVVNHILMAERAGREARIIDLRQIYDLFLYGYKGGNS